MRVHCVVVAVDQFLVDLVVGVFVFYLFSFQCFCLLFLCVWFRFVSLPFHWARLLL